MNKMYALASTLLFPLVLGGCDSFRNTLGLDHYSPNEMETSGPSPSLILPPDFAQRPKLPPPTPGAPNPHEISASARAEKTVLGDTPPAETSTPPGKGEKDVIEKASENQTITPDIRKKVDEESQSDSSVSEKVISKIRSWKKEATDNLTLSKSDKEDHDIDTRTTQSDNNPTEEEEEPESWR